MTTPDTSPETFVTDPTRAALEKFVAAMHACGRWPDSSSDRAMLDEALAAAEAALAAPQSVMLNGLTADETSASASVAGLTLAAPPPSAHERIPMSDTKHPALALEEEITEYVTAYGGENTATMLLFGAATHLARIPVLEAEIEELRDDLANYRHLNTRHNALAESAAAHRAEIARLTAALDDAQAEASVAQAAVESLRLDGERLDWVSRHAHWEDARDMAPGGRWWASIHAERRTPDMRAAIDAARGAK